VGSNVIGNIKLSVDEHGRMRSLDAVGTAVNWIASVERENKNFAEYLDAMARRRWTEKSFAPKAVRDTARLVLENKKIEVDY
jgi:hypothetical protein